MAPSSAAPSRSHSRSPSVSGKASPSRTPSSSIPGVLRLPNSISPRNSVRARRPPQVIKRPTKARSEEPPSVEHSNDEDAPSSSAQPNMSTAANDEDAGAQATPSKARRNNRRRRHSVTGPAATSSSSSSTNAVQQASTSSPSPAKAPSSTKAKSPLHHSSTSAADTTPSPDPSPVKGKRRGKEQSSLALTSKAPPGQVNSNAVFPNPPPSSSSVVVPSTSALSRSAPSPQPAFPTPTTGSAATGPGKARSKKRQQHAQSQLLHPQPTAASSAASSISRPRSVPLESSLDAAGHGSSGSDGEREAARAVSLGSSPSKAAGAMTWQQEMFRSHQANAGTPSSSPNKRRPRQGRAPSGLAPPAPLHFGSADEQGMFAMDDLNDHSPALETQFDRRLVFDSSPLPYAATAYTHSQPSSPNRGSPSAQHRKQSQQQQQQHLLQPRMAHFPNEPPTGYQSQHVHGADGFVKFATPKWRQKPGLGGLKAPAFLSTSAAVEDGDQPAVGTKVFA